MSIAHVIFDAFGTLVRRPNPFSFRHHPLPSPETAMTEVRDWHAWTDQHGVQEDLQRDLDSIVAYDDVLPALEALRQHNIGWSIMSNLASCYGDPLRRALAVTETYPPKYWFLSYQDGLRKPDAVYYNSAVLTIGLHPEALLFIGDTRRDDVEGPASVGMNAVLLDRNRTTLTDTVIPLLTPRFGK